MFEARRMLFAVLVLAMGAGCSENEPQDGAAGAGGTAGTGGTGGTGGMAGAGGTAGTGGTGGTGGEAAAFTFFVTSEGSAELGGNLGGLSGADAICQSLAEVAGIGNATWRAYLSTTDEDARDRIGTGPWFNFDGDMIAADVDSLHNDGLSNGMPQQVLDEFGNPAPASEHDILTGSQDDGTLFTDRTCEDWTSSSDIDSARVGHSDIPANPTFSPSWNNAHDTAGCGQSDLAMRGGSGRLYCFAL